MSTPRNIRGRLLLLAVVVLGGAAAGAQPAPPSGWQPGGALLGLMPRDVAQTPGHWLWVATESGVYASVGGRTVSLNALRRRGPALPGSACNHLLLTPDGRLWLGTVSGAYQFTPTGTLAPVPLPVPTAAPIIDALAADPAGRRVWVAQSSAGLRAYDAAGRPVGPRLLLADALLDLWVAPDRTL